MPCMSNLGFLWQWKRAVCSRFWASSLRCTGGYSGLENSTLRWGIGLWPGSHWSHLAESKWECGFSKEQRGLFQVGVLCVRWVCGPGVVGDECLDAGEECRCFSPRAFVWLAEWFYRWYLDVWKCVLKLAKCILPCFLRLNLFIPSLHTPDPKAAHMGALWRLAYYPGTCRAFSKVFAVKYMAPWNGWMWCYESPRLGLDFLNTEAVTLVTWGRLLPALLGCASPSPDGPHNGLLAKEKCSWLAHFHSLSKYHRRSSVTVLTKENELPWFCFRS